MQALAQCTRTHCMSRFWHHPLAMTCLSSTSLPTLLPSYLRSTWCAVLQLCQVSTPTAERIRLPMVSHVASLSFTLAFCLLDSSLCPRPYCYTWVSVKLQEWVLSTDVRWVRQLVLFPVSCHTSHLGIHWQMQCMETVQTRVRRLSESHSLYCNGSSQLFINCLVKCHF
jgi:hypothetical protein